ncbi:MAG: SUMF1/EgtB/PvdO family nonheme iron enzyme [Pirellulaceae bacterium]|nr:SUMF1/EgtB/PvdO family nonheme iron enzyme [Pirellulaceae bacterium]
MKIESIAAGQYEIGDDGVPNASPKHSRFIGTPFWILAIPFSWKLFEDAILVESSNSKLLDLDLKSCCRDTRIRQYLEASTAMEVLLPWSQQSMIDLPLTGLTWFESDYLARLLGGRLPTEVEWEILVRSETKSTGSLNQTSKRRELPLQEWTADAFAPKYWRADFRKRGTPWHEGMSSNVTIRGHCSNELHRHPCYRRGGDPTKSHPQRGFRVAWDQDPKVSVRFFNQ